MNITKKKFISNVIIVVLIACISFSLIELITEQRTLLTSGFLRFFLYLIYFYWLISIAIQEKNSFLYLFAFIIFLPEMLINYNWSLSSTTFSNLLFQKILWYSSFFLIFLWLIWILKKYINTFLGYFIIINVVVSIFIFLPFGIPNINFSVYPIYEIKNYNPFSTFNQLPNRLLDLRLISTIIFVLYFLIKSFKNIKTKEYNKQVDNLLQENQSDIFFDELLHFIWKLIYHTYIYVKFFLKNIKKNLIDQFTRSYKAYFFSFIIAFIFLLPFALKYLSHFIINYNLNFTELFKIKNSENNLLVEYILFPLFIIIIFFVITALLYYIPLYILNFIKREGKNIDFDFLTIKLSAKLNTPIYIIITGIGISSLLLAFKDLKGIFYILFSIIVIRAISLGISNNKN